MSTRVNFYNLQRRNFSPTQWPEILFEGLAPLTVLMFILLLIPPPSSEFTPLKEFSQIEFFRTLRLACLNLDTAPHLTELKDNFLTNKRLTDHALRQTFQNAGLAHLLALSGSQTGPVSTTICVFFMSLGLACIGSIRPLAKHSLVLGIRVAALLAELASLIGLVGLFQSTGALNRILSSKIALLLLYPLKSSDSHSPVQQMLLEKKITILFPWMLASVLGKNPVHDLSFLLSVLGANTAHIISTWVQTNWSDPEKKSSSDDSSIACKAKVVLLQITQWTVITALTSALMCFLCFQLWPVSNVFDKVLANLLAGPLVLFLITPAALIVIACLAMQLELLLIPARHVLETGLSVLISIAESFSTSPHASSPSSMPFARAGGSYEWFQHPYLGLCLIILTLSGVQIFVNRFRLFRLKETTEPAFDTHRISDSHWVSFFGKVPIWIMEVAMKAKVLRLTFVFALLFTSVAPWTASAAPKGNNKSLESSKTVKYKKKTEVNFDDATIEGSVRTPPGQGLGSRDSTFKNNFIKVRKNFHDQMLMSSGGLSP